MLHKTTQVHNSPCIGLVNSAKIAILHSKKYVLYRECVLSNTLINRTLNLRGPDVDQPYTTLYTRWNETNMLMCISFKEEQISFTGEKHLPGLRVHEVKLIMWHINKPESQSGLVSSRRKLFTRAGLGSAARLRVSGPVWVCKGELWSAAVIQCNVRELSSGDELWKPLCESGRISRLSASKSKLI